MADNFSNFWQQFTQQKKNPSEQKSNNDTLDEIFEVLQAAPVFGEMIAEIIRSATGKFPVTKIVDAVKDFAASDLKPIVDALEDLGRKSMRKRAGFVVELMNDFHLSEDGSLRVLEMQVYQDRMHAKSFIDGIKDAKNKK